MTESAIPAIGFELELAFTVERAASGEAFHDHGERVMEELLRLEDRDADISDPSVTTTGVGRGTITISLLILSGDEVEALDRALTVIRSAVHAAGGATPFWPTVDDFVDADVEYQPPQIQMGRAQAVVG